MEKDSNINSIMNARGHNIKQQENLKAMSREKLENEIRDNIYRLKLQKLTKRISENQNLKDSSNEEFRPKETMTFAVENKTDNSRDMKMQYMEKEIKEAKNKYEKLKTKLKHQEMERNIRDSVMRSNGNTDYQGKDHFSQFMEMMVLQQTQSQNIIMNQMMLRNNSGNTHTIPFQQYSFPNNLPQNVYIYPQPVEPIPTIEKPQPLPQIKKTLKTLQPYPGNDAQRKIRQIGLAALFCAILDHDFQEKSLFLSDKFLFEVKIKEIITTIEKYYINPGGEIYNILNSLINQESPNFRILIMRTGTNEELVFAEKQLNYSIQNIIAKMAEIMPNYGTLGCECKSILSEFLQNNQTFPERFFFAREKDLLQFDSGNTIRNVGFNESQILLIGIFLVRTLVMHIMMKSVEYNLCSTITITGKENLRILASVFIKIYQLILEQFIVQKYPNEAKNKTGLSLNFFELESALLNESELQPLVKLVKRSMEYAKTVILNWSQIYVMKLRPM